MLLYTAAAAAIFILLKINQRILEVFDLNTIFSRFKTVGVLRHFVYNKNNNLNY